MSSYHHGNLKQELISCASKICERDGYTKLSIRSLAKEKPIGLFQFDSHSDTWDSYFGGYKYTHGTPFRRAIEENLIDPKRYVILGLRGGLYDPDDMTWARSQGITIITIDEYYKMGFEESMKLVKDVLGETPPNTADAMKRYKAGKAGFTDKAHLKAKGLIPRSDGKKKVSDKYK